MIRPRRPPKYYNPDKPLCASQLERDWTNYVERRITDKLFYEQQQHKLNTLKRQKLSVTLAVDNVFHENFENYILSLSYPTNQDDLKFQVIK